jgi:hypothetical protein
MVPLYTPLFFGWTISLKRHSEPPDPNPKLLNLIILQAKRWGKIFFNDL